MKRRDFITLLGGTAVWPLSARAQLAAMPVIGFLAAGSLDVDGFRVEAVRKVLIDVGYVEGRNVTFEYKWAEGHRDRLPALAADLVHRDVAVIIAMGGNDSAVAAKSATSKVPIVIAIGGDPIKLGLVASPSRPGGNVTGVSFLVDSLVAKQFEVLHETVPNANLIGCLVNPTNANAEIDIKDIEEAADFTVQKLLVVRVRNDGEMAAAFITLT